MTADSFSKPTNRIRFAIFINILASACYAIMLSIAKSSTPSCSINQLVFIKSLIALLLIMPCIAYHKTNTTLIKYLKSKHLFTHAVRAVSSVFSIYIFLIAIKTISISEANLLFNTSPAFIPLISYAWKRIPVDNKIWPGIIIAFLGVAFLIRPGQSSCAAGFWIALSGGFVSAISVMALRFSHYTEPLCRSIFYYALFSSLITGLLCLIEGRSLSFLFESTSSVSFAFIGITGFLCQFFFAISLKYAPAKLITPFCYISVIFSLILDLIFWEKQLHILEIFGILFILTGLYLIVFLLYKKNHTVSDTAIGVDE